MFSLRKLFQKLFHQKFIWLKSLSYFILLLLLPSSSLILMPHKSKKYTHASITLLVRIVNTNEYHSIPLQKPDHSP